MCTHIPRIKLCWSSQYCWIKILLCCFRPAWLCTWIHLLGKIREESSNPHPAALILLIRFQSLKIYWGLQSWVSLVMCSLSLIPDDNFVAGKDSCTTGKPEGERFIIVRTETLPSYTCERPLLSFRWMHTGLGWVFAAASSFMNSWFLWHAVWKELSFGHNGCLATFCTKGNLFFSSGYSCIARNHRAQLSDYI